MRSKCDFESCKDALTRKYSVKSLPVVKLSGGEWVPIRDNGVLRHYCSEHARVISHNYEVTHIGS